VLSLRQPRWFDGAVQQVSRLTAPFFPALGEVGEFTQVDADQLPADYQMLLAHDDHMTVTVEAFHDCRVDVRVLDERREDGAYSRTSVLACQATAKPVQFGIMRVEMGQLSEAVRRDIESRSTPLGRVLIRHNVLRHVELLHLWRVHPGPVLREQLRLDGNAPVYGRTARIVVEGRPAVELLEIPRA
jgi:chorismate-pyruvate lyase